MKADALASSAAWRWPAAALLLLTLAVPAPAQRGGRASVDLAPGDHGELARIELRQGTSADGQHVRRPITDLLLRVRAPGGDAEAALHAPNGYRPGERQPLFLLDVALVAGGRLVLDERVACQGWIADVSICHAECDGGQFALERGDGAAYTVTFGRLPKDLGEHLEPGYRMHACGGAGHMLAPVRATSATVALVAR